MASLWDELEALSENVQEPVAQETTGSLWDELEAPEVQEPTEEPTISLDLGEPNQQVIEEVPGTVQVEDTQTTMTLPEVEAAKQQAQENIDYPLQSIAGIRQSVTLPLAKAVEDGLNKIGIDVSTESSKNLTKVNKYIKDYNDKHPDQVIHPATIGNIASQLVVPVAKTIKGIAATEALLNALNGIGKREDYDDVILDATTGAAFGASSMALFNRLTRNVGPLSYEAKLLIDKHPELNEADVIKTLEGVPKADQAYALSNIVEDDFVDFAAKAIKPDNKDKLLLKNQLAGRTKVVQDTIGNVDNQVDEARDIYSNMVDEIALNHPDTFKFDSMIPKLDVLIKRYDKTPSKALSIVNNMKADLEAGQGMMDMRTASQFRQDLNYLVNKAKRHEEKALLKSIKGGVDTFITRNLDEPTLHMVDSAITNYSRAMNNKDFIDIMSKYVKQKSTDWVGLQKALKAEKLSSPEVDNALEIVKEFSEKFKNDKQLRTAVKVQGQAEDPGGMLGLMSYAINKTRDTLIPFGKRHRELKIQEAILKSIRQAKDPIDVFRKMEVNGVPPKIRKELQESLLLEWKSQMKTTGDVELTPKYVTPEGTVGTDASQVSLHDAQRELVRKALGNNYNDDLGKVIEEKINTPRFDKIISDVRSKLKADEIQKVEDIKRREADLLIKEIQRSSGIKIPKSEADKIIQIKLSE